MMWKAVPDERAKNYYVDPIEFSVTFALAANPFKPNIPTISGASAPFFIVLDYLIGRNNFESELGQEILYQCDWFPENWKQFTNYVRCAKVWEKIPSRLEYVWKILKEEYAGERGFLGNHKYRAYSFTELGSHLGKVTNGGSSDSFNTLDQLEESRLELERQEAERR